MMRPISGHLALSIVNMPQCLSDSGEQTSPHSSLSSLTAAWSAVSPGSILPPDWGVRPRLAAFHEPLPATSQGKIGSFFSSRIYIVWRKPKDVKVKTHREFFRFQPVDRPWSTGAGLSSGRARAACRSDARLSFWLFHLSIGIVY